MMKLSIGVILVFSPLITIVARECLQRGLNGLLDCMVGFLIRLVLLAVVVAGVLLIESSYNDDKSC